MTYRNCTHGRVSMPKHLKNAAQRTCTDLSPDDASRPPPPPQKPAYSAFPTPALLTILARFSRSASCASSRKAT